MKGLILAAGLGTRLRPITSLKPKPTISVANRPLIHHAVQNLVDAGVSEIGIVVSHDTIKHLQASLEDYPGASFTYLIQDPPLGLAHAVKVSRGFLGDSPFVMYLGDNLFEQGIGRFVDAYRPEDGVNAVLALVPVDDPRQLGVAVVKDGRIIELVEKPEVPPSNLAIAGVYVLDASIHPIIEELKPGAKDEYQITDAIHDLIRQGGHVAPVQVEGWWKDTGKPEDILDANRLLLMRIGRQVDGAVEDSELVGDVVVEAGANVKGSTVFGPVIIGAGARVERSYLGPFTTVGPGSVIEDAEVEYSVIGSDTSIRDIGTRVRESLIGDGVRLEGTDNRPGSHRLVIGDESEVLLHER